MRRSLTLAGVACFVLFLATANADWPTYRNDNARIGGTSEKISHDLVNAWVYNSPAKPETAWSGPRSTPIEGKVMRLRTTYDGAYQVAAVGDHVFFGSSVNHNIYCVSAKTGQAIWTYPTDGPVRLSPTVSGGKVYVGSDDGHVYCLDAKTGKLAWRIQAGPTDERLLARGRMISRWPIRTGVLVDNGIAYFGAGVIPHETVYLIAVRADTGELVWRNDHISQEDAGRNPLSPQGYLLCSDTQLFVPSGRSLPAAFDRKTGEEIHHRKHSWRTAAGGVVGGTKALLADGQIYTGGPDHFLALDQKTGSVGFAWITGRQLALSGNKGFVADGKRIVAIDRLAHAKATIARQKLNLELYSLRRKRGSMKAAEYRSKTNDLDLRIKKLSDVGTLWETAAAQDSFLIVAGDRVIAGGANKVIALDSENGNITWQADVDGDVQGLAASGGNLFVSTNTGKVYGFVDRSQGPAAVAQWPASKPSLEKTNLDSVYADAAEEILKQTGQTRGFCLIVGSERGLLARELAKRSKLRIYGIEPDRQKAIAARKMLDELGLHGSRVTIVHGDPAKMPFSNYFANLVVSDTLMLTGKVPGDPRQWARATKPIGGTICLYVAKNAPAAKRVDRAALQQLMQQVNFTKQAESIRDVNGLLGIVRRGALPGAGRWSHQYGDVANTSTSQDQRVRGGMGVLWYGDPGPAQMVNRHEAAAAPLSTNGRMFIQGIDSILCYDAYNGLFNWEYKNPGALRTGVFNNEETSNLAASDDQLFVAVDRKCTAIDAATGKVRAVYETPKSEDGLERVWGYVATKQDVLFGTSTIRSELERALRRRGHTVKNATDAIFAIDTRTGKRKWTYRGKDKSILHVTIAIGDNRVYFIESSLTKEQRKALLRKDKSELKKLGPEEAKKKEAELKKLDIRLAVCLNAETGQKLWEKAVDVTDCSRVGIGGGNLTLMYSDGHVLICGANANGHYWRQFLSGQFGRRRLVVLDGKSGKKLWAKDANYRHRPIIVGKEIYAEPWAFDLHSGTEKTRFHPITGEKTKWQFSRPGHHCGPITATPNMLFFRSGFTGYYDLYSDSGTTHFAGHRMGCWVNAIPGNGLLMIPEASAGCVCQFSLASTIVMEPRTDRDSWRLYSTTGVNTPVKNMAINIGGPGDRRDKTGKLWLCFPRPKTVGRLEYVFDIKPKFGSGGSYYTRNEESVALNTETPWLYVSGASGMARCELPLLGKKDRAASYTVKLHFAEIDDVEPGQRLFDIKLQGAIVAKGVDVVREAGGVRKPLVRTFKNIDVSGNLQIELVPRQSGAVASKPIISAIEVDREDE